MSWVNAPEGMSYINVWHALEKHAEPKGFMTVNAEAFQEAQQCTASCVKVDQLFQNFPLNRHPPFSMDYESGKALKVHFDQFPKLYIENYDSLYGKGAAERILQEYAKIPSKDRFDANDTYQFSDLQKNYNLRKQTF